MLDLSEYLAAADIVAISACIEDGSYRFAFDRVGGHGAIWVEASLALKITRQLKKQLGDCRVMSDLDQVDGCLTTLVCKAAAACGAHPTSHQAVLAKARQATERIDTWMKTANASGLLGAFNREYRRRRLDDQTHGRRTMTFSSARKRLRRALIRRLISGVTAESEILREVFSCQR